MARLFVFIPVLLLAGTLACGPTPAAPREETASGGPVHGGRITIRVANDPFDWDLSYAGKSNPNQTGIAMGYNSLLGFRLGPGINYEEVTLAPELAERWEVSPDARGFRFTLRKGVRFAASTGSGSVKGLENGRELTPADVKWTYEYWSRTGAFKGVAGGQFRWMFEGLERIDTPDAETVVMQFKEPFTPFLTYAAAENNAIVPREIHAQDGHLKERIAGTGAFQLDSGASQKGTRWVWNKNPDYWESGKPYVDQIIWLVLPNDATENAGFQTRQIDLLDGLGYRRAQEVIKDNPRATVVQYVSPTSSGLYLSQARPGPLQDIRVRRAVAYAIDRDEILRTLTGGHGAWGLSGALYGLFSDQEVKSMLKHDPAEARRLLAEAGYGQGVQMEWPFSTASSDEQVSHYQLIQAQLRRVGINAALKPLDKAAQRVLRYSGNFDLDIGGQGTGGLDEGADAILFGKFYGGSSGNYSKVSDPQLDRLLEGARREPDAEKRRGIMREAVKRIQEMAWAVDLYYAPLWDVRHPHVQNYYPNFATNVPFMFAWVQE